MSKPISETLYSGVSNTTTVDKCIITSWFNHDSRANSIVMSCGINDVVIVVAKLKELLKLILDNKQMQ